MLNLHYPKITLNDVLTFFFIHDSQTKNIKQYILTSYAKLKQSIDSDYSIECQLSIKNIEHKYIFLLLFMQIEPLSMKDSI